MSGISWHTALCYRIQCRRLTGKKKTNTERQTFHGILTLIGILRSTSDPHHGPMMQTVQGTIGLGTASAGATLRVPTHWHRQTQISVVIDFFYRHQLPPMAQPNIHLLHLLSRRSSAFTYLYCCKSAQSILLGDLSEL